MTRKRSHRPPLTVRSVADIGSTTPRCHRSRTSGTRRVRGPAPTVRNRSIPHRRVSAAPGRRPRPGSRRGSSGDSRRSKLGPDSLGVNTLSGHTDNPSEGWRADAQRCPRIRHITTKTRTSVRTCRWGNAPSTSSPPLVRLSRSRLLVERRHRTGQGGEFVAVPGQGRLAPRSPAMDGPLSLRPTGTRRSSAAHRLRHRRAPQSMLVSACTQGCIELHKRWLRRPRPSTSAHVPPGSAIAGCTTPTS